MGEKFFFDFAKHEWYISEHRLKEEYTNMFLTVTTDKSIYDSFSKALFKFTIQ